MSILVKLPSLPLQSPHTSGKNQIRAFTFMVPATPMYLSGSGCQESQYFFSLRLEVSECRFPQNTTCSMFQLRYIHQMADWLQQEQTCPLATAVQLPLPKELIVQPNCKLRWDGALLKSLYFSLQQVCLLVDIKNKIQLNLLRQ